MVIFSSPRNVPAKRRCLSSLSTDTASSPNLASFCRHFCPQHSWAEHKHAFTTATSQQFIFDACVVLRCILQRLSLLTQLSRWLLLLFLHPCSHALPILFLSTFCNSCWFLLFAFVLVAVAAAYSSLSVSLPLAEFGTNSSPDESECIGVSALELSAMLNLWMLSNCDPVIYTCENFTPWVLIVWLWSI